jgi:hypothetical protein
MKRAFGTLVVIVGCVLVVAGCSSGGGTSADGSGTAASSSAGSSGSAGQSSGAASAPTSGTVVGPTSGAAEGSFAANGSCALQHRENLILWEKRPDSPATAKTVSDIDYATCQYAKDSLALTEPTDPGYCDILARPSDNPGYDVKAASPPKPAHILTQAGNGC